MVASLLVEQANGRLERAITEHVLAGMPWLASVVSVGKQGGRGFDFNDFRRFVSIAAKCDASMASVQVEDR